MKSETPTPESKWLNRDWNVVTGGEPTGCSIRSLVRPNVATETALAALLDSLRELVNSPNAKSNAMWDRARALVAEEDAK